MIDHTSTKLRVGDTATGTVKFVDERGEPAVDLTDAAVRKYVAKSWRRRIPDGKSRSLFLIVEPSGRKSWRMRFRRPNGKPAKLTLGPFYDPSAGDVETEPAVGMPLSLARARLLAAQIHSQRARGQDAIAEHKAAKSRRRAEIESQDESGFPARVGEYIDQHAKKHTRNWRETAKLLGLRYSEDGEPEAIKGGLVDRWSDRPARAIDGHDVWSVIDEARRTAVPGVKARNRDTSEPRARGLFVALSSLFGWLQKRRLVDANPCSGVPRPANAASRERTLTDDEIRLFWLASDRVDAPKVLKAPRPFRPMLRMLLLSGGRLREVAGMRRDELSADGMVWTLPGARTKNKKPHVVPLSPLAREQIEEAGGKGDFVFSSNGRTSVSGFSRAKRRLDKAMLDIAKEQNPETKIVPPWRLHDLRRTAVTGMAEIGIAPHVIELVVNHVSGHKAGVAGVYNKSELLAERKAALERWADHVVSIVERKPAKILQMKKRKGAASAVRR
jgi:integrase